jgi:hypothetical protein
LFPKVGKLEQYKLLVANPIASKHIPVTLEYTKENLFHLLDLYQIVYIKHDTSGQGRGVFKLTKRENNFQTLNGYSIVGTVVNRELEIDQIHSILHPFERLGRLNPYIIQEGVESVSKNGQPLNIRVHVQFIKTDWVIGGMYASVGFDDLEENGVVNPNRGSHIVSIQELFQSFLGLDHDQERDIMSKISSVSIEASKAIASKYWSREFGVDIGLDHQCEPVIFEVNTTPGIGGFYKADKKLWEHIVDTRKIL